VRVPLETLESRVLLSVGPTVAELSPLALSITMPNPVMVRPQPAVEAAAGVIDPLATPATSGTIDVSGPKGGGLLARLRAGQTDPTGPIDLGMMTIVSETSGNLGEDGYSPVVMWTPWSDPSTNPTWSEAGPSPGFQGGGVVWLPVGAGAVSPTVPGGGSDGTPGSWTGEASPDPSVSAGSGVGISYTTPTGVPPTPGAGGAAIGVPDMRHVVVDSAFDSGAGYQSYQGYQSYKIPLDPATRMLGLSLRGQPGNNPSQWPAFGEMSLVDRQGDTLAQFDPPVAGPTGGPPDAVTLAFNNLPDGGSLVVEVAMPSRSAPGGSSATPAATGTTIPFVIDIQRLESPSPAQGAGIGSVVAAPSSPGTLVIGAMPGAVDSAGQDGSAMGSDAIAATPEATASVLVDLGEAIPATDSSPALAPSLADIGTRISTGPMAARTAAPLGPDLSDVVLDPVPAIDRHELALAQEITADDADEGRVSRNLRSPLRNRDEAPTPGGDDPESEEPGPPVVAYSSIAGLGPLSLKVAEAGVGRRRGDLEDLHAALVLATSRPEQRAEGDVPTDEPDLVAVAAPASSDGERRPSLDYVTSACILAMGMGLMTGPIIPDLLRLLPPRSSRWRGVRATGMSRLLAGSSREQIFGTWRRKRIRGGISHRGIGDGRS
jgi:hypothetical protein